MSAGRFVCVNSISITIYASRKVAVVVMMEIINVTVSAADSFAK